MNEPDAQRSSEGRGTEAAGVSFEDGGRRSCNGIIILVSAADAITAWGCLVLFGIDPFYFLLRGPLTSPALPLTVVAVFLVITICAVRQIEGKVKALTYVPPVREQIAALPAEEILVRGSHQPATTTDELLRASQAGTETNAQELLRAESTVL